MNNTKIACPKWTRDLHEKELYKIDKVTNKIFEILRWNWYQRIDTPTFEHTDVFKKSGGFFPDKCYVFSDKSWRELLLRTDINAPISRSILNNPTLYTLPEKLFFCDKIFRYRNWKKREFRMCWIELYWVDTFSAELDIFMALEKIIKATGFSDYRIEFNNLKLIQKLLYIILENNWLDSSNLDEYIYTLRHGNSIEVLNNLNIKSEDKNLISALLENKENNFELLEDLTKKFPELKDIKDEIEFFYNLMQQYWINCIFKMSELHWTWFYSWLTYKIFVDNIEDELWDGWRYDNMTASLWWKTIPATWIWFWIERLIRFMDSKGSSELFLWNKKILFYVKDEAIKLDIYKYLAENDIEDVTIEVDIMSKKTSDAIKYAKKKDYNYVIVVDKSEYKIINIVDNVSFVKACTSFDILDALNSLDTNNK